MNSLDFAMSLIRAPWLKKLTDRTFLASLGTAITAIGGTVAVWNTKGVPIGDKVNTTIAAIGAVTAVATVFTHSEKKKDTAIAQAALAVTVPVQEGVKATLPFVSGVSWQDLAAPDVAVSGQYVDNSNYADSAPQDDLK